MKLRVCACIQMENSHCKITREQTNIIYDGSCPVCSAYIRHTDLEDSSKVNYIDARQCPDIVCQFLEQGIDLDEGLVVTTGNEVHHGADAMHVLSALTNRHGFWNRAMTWMFGTQQSSRIIYPVFRTGRNFLLRLLRRPRLNYKK